MLKMARKIREDTGVNNLALAGCVALNCVSNGKLLKSGLISTDSHYMFLVGGVKDDRRILKGRGNELFEIKKG